MIYVTGPLNNRVVIDSGATAEFGAANNTANGGSVGVLVAFNDAGGTLKLDHPAQNLPSTPNAFNGQIVLSARQTGTSPFDRLDLTGQSVSSATMNGTTLTVTTAAGTQIYNNIVGQLGATPGATINIPFVPDGAGGTYLELTPVGSLWGSFVIPRSQ